MKRSILTGAALLAFIAACPPLAAVAQNLPALRPTHDVAVVYRAFGSPSSSGPEQVHTIRMAWGDRGQELRVEIDRLRTVTLIDFRQQRVTMLVEPRRLALEFTLDPRLIPGFVIPADAALPVPAPTRWRARDATSGISPDRAAPAPLASRAMDWSCARRGQWRTPAPGGWRRCPWHTGRSRPRCSPRLPTTGGWTCKRQDGRLGPQRGGSDAQAWLQGVR